MSGQVSHPRHELNARQIDTLDRLLGAALTELDAQGLREIVVFLAHYAGWPVAAAMNNVVEKVGTITGPTSHISRLSTGIGACFISLLTGPHGSGGTHAESFSFSMASTIARTPFSVDTLSGVLAPAFISVAM